MTNLCTYIQFHLHNISLSLLRNRDSAKATRCSDLSSAQFSVTVRHTSHIKVTHKLIKARTERCKWTILFSDVVKCPPLRSLKTIALPVLHESEITFAIERAASIIVPRIIVADNIVTRGALNKGLNAIGVHAD